MRKVVWESSGGLSSLTALHLLRQLGPGYTKKKERDWPSQPIGCVPGHNGSSSWIADQARSTCYSVRTIIGHDWHCINKVSTVDRQPIYGAHTLSRANQ